MNCDVKPQIIKFMEKFVASATLLQNGLFGVFESGWHKTAIAEPTRVVRPASADE